MASAHKNECCGRIGSHQLGGGGAAQHCVHDQAQLQLRQLAWGREYAWVGVIRCCCQLPGCCTRNCKSQPDNTWRLTQRKALVQRLPRLCYHLKGCNRHDTRAAKDAERFQARLAHWELGVCHIHLPLGVAGKGK